VTWWQWLINGSIACVILVIVVKWLVRTGDKLIDRVIPLIERYVLSTESLHMNLDDRIGSQQGLCQQHGAAVSGVGVAVTGVRDTLDRNNASWQRVAKTMCAGCREVVEREKPACADIVLRHCDEIERIIGEA